MRKCTIPAPQPSAASLRFRDRLQAACLQEARKLGKAGAMAPAEIERRKAHLSGLRLALETLRQANWQTCFCYVDSPCCCDAAVRDEALMQAAQPAMLAAAAAEYEAWSCVCKQESARAARRIRWGKWAGVFPPAAISEVFTACNLKREEKQ